MKSKKNLERISAFLLAVVMLIAIFPSGIFAEEKIEKSAQITVSIEDTAGFIEPSYFATNIPGGVSIAECTIDVAQNTTLSQAIISALENIGAEAVYEGALEEGFRLTGMRNITLPNGETLDYIGEETFGNDGGWAVYVNGKYHDTTQSNDFLMPGDEILIQSVEDINNPPEKPATSPKEKMIEEETTEEISDLLSTETPMVLTEETLEPVPEEESRKKSVAQSSEMRNTTPLLKGLYIKTKAGTGKPLEKDALLWGEEATLPETIAFDPAVTHYELKPLIDLDSTLRFNYTKNTTDNIQVIAYGMDYSKTPAVEKKATIGMNGGVLTNVVHGGHNSFRVEVQSLTNPSRPKDVYTFNIDSYPTLNSLEVKSLEDLIMPLNEAFSPRINAYTMDLPGTTEKLVVNAVATERLQQTSEIKYNGQTSTEVDVNPNDEKLVISVTNQDGLVSDYTINYNFLQSLSLSFEKTPEDTLVAIYDPLGKRILPDENGVFNGLLEGKTYTYTATAKGYIGKKETFVAGEIDNNVVVNLEEAPESTIEDVSADWKNFRDDDHNMAIVNAETPILTENTGLLWAKKFGTGWDAAPSVQIIVDDTLVVLTANKKIYKLDLATGDILQQADLVEAPNWGYTPPAYADGLILCPIGKGVIQAFNAKTLESVWVYRPDAALQGGDFGLQSLTPITVSDGYMYTGFWASEKGEANYVCLSMTDEDPTQATEAKIPSWEHRVKGGFYWAGSVVIGEHVIFGTDDGEDGWNGNSKLLSLNKNTGEVVSELDIIGDQRSSIAYDEPRGRIFFTSKQGILYSAAIDPLTGTLSDLKETHNNSSPQEDWQCTSTPVVYKDRIYYGIGRGISTHGGYIICADADSLKEVYRVPIINYPQCSPLISTAYEEETGYIHLYTTYNYLPGGITMLKMKPDAKSAEEVIKEEIFAEADYAQYCITSLITSPDGILYYKNDSGHVFGVTDLNIYNMVPALQVVDEGGAPSSQVVKKPLDKALAYIRTNKAAKLYYNYTPAGQTPVAPTDQSPHVNVNSGIVPVTLEGIEEAGGTLSLVLKDRKGEKTEVIQVEVVAESVDRYGDVDKDGSITAYDASLILQYVAGNIGDGDLDISVADLDGNGTITAYDASLILQYVAGNISSFPVE